MLAVNVVLGTGNCLCSAGGRRQPVKKKESMAEVTSPSVSKLYGGLRFETTNQLRYKPLPTGTVMPTAFLVFVSITA